MAGKVLLWRMRYGDVQLRVRFGAAVAWTRTVSFTIPYCISVLVFVGSSVTSEALLGASGSAEAHATVAVRGDTVTLIMSRDR